MMMIAATVLTPFLSGGGRGGGLLVPRLLSLSLLLLVLGLSRSDDTNDVGNTPNSSNAMEGTSSNKCPTPAAATTFIITGSTIRADNGETPDWFELAEIKLFTADGTNVAPDASYEFLVEPSNPQDKDVLTDGEIFDETSGKFVVWGGLEEEQEQLVYAFHGEDVVQIIFDSPVEIVSVELYSTNYESFGTDCVVASVDMNTETETETGLRLPLPLRIVYDAHPTQNRGYAHCFENGVEFAVETNCSTIDGADPPFKLCSPVQCPPAAAATTFIITGSTIRADNGETPDWFELAEIKLFTADGTNVAPDASYEFLVEPSNPQDKDVLTDGEIFDETSGKFVVWGGSEEEEEQELVYAFRGEDLVQITFDSPVEIVSVELYSTNYESFGTDCVVASIDMNTETETETKTGLRLPLPLRIVYDAHPTQNRGYAHCLENGVEFAVETNCSTIDGADPPFKLCSHQVPTKVEQDESTDSNTVDTAVIDGDIDTADADADTDAYADGVVNIMDAHYNVNETRGEFEFRIQPYPIPIKTTTYVDFVFNLPEELPPLVHIVFGEAIVSQPQHLHHFVITGCTTKLDIEEVPEGMPLDRPPRDCTIPLGMWAPGASLFNGTPDLSIGVAMGKAMGIQAVQLNIHYTDGVYDDEELETYKIATDGIKVYYTTDLREYTAMTKPLINIPLGPPELYIPAKTERYFVTRTCHVETKCKDASKKQLQQVAALFGVGQRSSGEGGPRQQNTGGDNDSDSTNSADSADTDAEAEAEAEADPNAAMMAEMLATISCPSIQPFCGMGGDLGPFIQQLCPVTCGYCDEGDGDAENPRNPMKYRATSILYHAHLLGAEMYATLLRPTTTTNEEEEEDRAEHDNDDGGGVSSSSMTQQQRASSMNATTTMIVKDLQSSEFWNFDNQVATPMENDYEIQVVTSSNNSEQEEQGSTMTTMEFIKGVEIVPGDHIQATCVYNSMYRDKSTQFGLSTYEEMCLIFLQITFPTPTLDLINHNNNNNNDLGSSLSLTADLNLRTFSCGVMEEEEEEDSEQSDNTEESTPAETTDTDTASTTQPTTTKKNVVFSDVWQGILESEEDPRNIWIDHPITSTEMCTFPVADYVFLEFMTFESRNCPLSMNSTTTHDFDSSSVCYGVETTTTNGDNNSDGSSEGVEFLTETIAGYTCVGGRYDDKDSNESPLYLTKEECLSQESGGTSYEAYTCADIQDWLRHEATMWGITDEVKEFLRTEWYQPKCCRDSSDGDDNGDTDIDNTSVCSGLNTEDGDTTVEFLMDTIAGYKCVGGSYDDTDSNEPPLLLTEEECLVGGGGSSYNAYTCKGIQKWLQKEEATTKKGITNDIKEYLKINWYQPTCCRVVRESDGNGNGNSETSTAADTTTTTVIAAADESSSSSSSTYSVAIVFATASVVIIIMMTTTTMMVL